MSLQEYVTFVNQKYNHRIVGFLMHVFEHMVKDINTAHLLVKAHKQTFFQKRIHFQHKHQMAYSVLSNSGIYWVARIMTTLHTHKINNEEKRKDRLQTHYGQTLTIAMQNISGHVFTLTFKKLIRDTITHFGIQGLQLCCRLILWQIYLIHLWYIQSSLSHFTISCQD